MQKYILALNAGSSSLRFSLYTTTLHLVLSDNIDRIGARGGAYATHAAAVQGMRAVMRKKGIVPAEIAVVGHRVVHGGATLRRPVRITASVERAIHTAAALAPLHNPPALMGIRLARRAFPRAAHIAVFDTGLYEELPEVAQTYALPKALARKYGLKRYGFHGLSHEYALHESARRLKKPERALNLLSVHLGSGSSMTAFAKGKPVATSMGFTPMEGLLMTTRVGDIDPGILLYLLKQGKTIKELDNAFNHISGWYGLTGMKDFRDVLYAAGFSKEKGVQSFPISKTQRHDAKLALELFLRRVRFYLGGYATLLGGKVDVIVFTGGIGGVNVRLWREIMRPFPRLRKVRIFRFPSDEAAVIARHAKRFL
ncbi:MAG: acetate kinase [Patescibacteria group bacterium]